MPLTELDSSPTTEVDELPWLRFRHGFFLYTQHGFADALATHIETTLGIDAQSLKENQTSLSEFG